MLPQVSLAELVMPACTRRSHKLCMYACNTLGHDQLPAFRLARGLSAACTIIFVFCEGLYHPGDWLMFGAETSGLPKEVSSCMSKQCIVALHRALSASETHTECNALQPLMTAYTGCGLSKHTLTLDQICIVW